MRAQKGFSLLELIVVIAVLIAIAGVVAPYVLGLLNDAKVQKVLETHARVSQAALEYRNDIMAANPSFTKNDPTLVPLEDTTQHDLYYDPGHKGWKGPYLTHPLTTKDHPSGGIIRLGNTGSFSGNPGDPVFAVDGWKIQGYAGPVVLGHGSYLAFSDVDEEFAMKVDEAIDAKVQGSDFFFGSASADWRMVGKCHFEPTFPGAPNSLCLFISDLDGK